MPGSETLRVREIRRIRSSSGCKLHTCPRNTIDLNSVLRTCSRNTTNSDIERQHCAHVFAKYNEFGFQAAAICTRVREIRRIRSSSGCILHTWSRNTTNSAALCTRVREIRRFGAEPAATCPTQRHPASPSVTQRHPASRPKRLAWVNKDI